MDVIVSLETDRLKLSLERIGKKFRGDMSGVFKDEIISFVEGEISAVISIIEDDTSEKFDKRIRISKAFGRLNGVEKTIGFVVLKQFGDSLPYSVTLLVAELRSLQNSIIKIMMNL